MLIVIKYFNRHRKGQYLW